jgi:hypothetical protein
VIGIGGCLALRTVEEPVLEGLQAAWSISRRPGGSHPTVHPVILEETQRWIEMADDKLAAGCTG